jgi:hypothetical protein
MAGIELDEGHIVEPLLERIDVTGAPRQSPGRVRRSAARFEVAVKVAAKKERAGEPVIRAEQQRLRGVPFEEALSPKQWLNGIGGGDECEHQPDGQESDISHKTCSSQIFKLP